jgi:hypothetical protein
MKPSRTTRLLGNDGLAKRDGKHLTSAGIATIGNESNANRGGIWNGDHQYATMGFETNTINGSPPSGFGGARDFQSAKLDFVPAICRIIWERRHKP